MATSGLAMERDELTPDARAALEAQLAKRGLGETQQRDFAISYRAETAREIKQRGPRRPMLPWTGSFEGYYGKRDLVRMHNG